MFFAKWAEQLFDTLKPGDPYYRHWVRFRQGLFLRLWGGCVFFPLFLGIILLFSWLISMEYAAFLALAITAILLMVSYWRYPLNCPSCKCSFYGQMDPRRNAYRIERCVYCGLQLFAPRDD